MDDLGYILDIILEASLDEDEKLQAIEEYIREKLNNNR